MKQTLLNLKSWLLMICLLVGVGNAWAEDDVIYSTGFESDFETSTTYTGTVTSGPTGKQWKVTSGTFSTSSAISGNNSAQTRLYSTTVNTPVVETCFTLENVTKITFMGAFTHTGNILVQYSTDGNNWTGDQTFTSSSTSDLKTYNMPESYDGSAVYFRFVQNYTSKPSSGNKPMRIDDVTVYGKENSGGTTSQPTALSAPSNLASSNVTTTGATLSWGAVSNASSYTVKIGETEYADVKTNSYAATGLTADTQYTWTVKAVGDGTNYTTSAYAANATFTTEAEQGGEDGDDEDGEKLTVTYNFNDKDAYPAGFPTSGTNTASAKTFKISGNDIIINAPTAYYTINSTTDNRGLFFGKTSNDNGKPKAGTAYLGFPAKEGYKLTKVVATSTTSMAGNLPLNIYTTSLEAVSTSSNTVNGAKTAHTFVINEPAENTEYWLTAGGSSGKNLQFDNIVLTYEKVEVPEPTYSEAKALNVTADNGNDLYFTTFSSDKVTFFPEYDDEEEFTFATSIKTAEVADEIFVLSQIEKGKATIGEEEVEGFFVPANTGVLVQVEYDGKAEKNVPYYEVENMNVDALENNDLHAGNGEMLPSGKVWYKLAWADASHAPSTLGFYYGAAEGAPFTSTKGKAYLGLTPEQAAKKISFSLVDDEATGIKTVDTVNGTSAVYNLAGQRVAPNAKGIVIVNGKKFINK